MVRDDAAGRIPPFQGIGKAQCDLSGGAAPRCRVVSQARKGAFKRLKRIRQPGIEEEAEPPRTSASGPHEPVRSVPNWTHFRLLMSSLSVTPRGRSILNCVREAPMGPCPHVV